MTDIYVLTFNNNLVYHHYFIGHTAWDKDDKVSE